MVRGGLNNPYGLAVDPFGRNIYWTDSTKQVIEIASTDGLYRRVLIKDNLQNPRDIILDVTRGYTNVSHSLCDCFKITPVSLCKAFSFSVRQKSVNS